MYKKKIIVIYCSLKKKRLRDLSGRRRFLFDFFYSYIENVELTNVLSTCLRIRTSYDIKTSYNKS